MKLFLAGNFSIMSDKEKERRMREVLGDRYHRLCSYFFKQTHTVVDMINEDEPKTKRVIKRTIKR